MVTILTELSFGWKSKVLPDVSLNGRYDFLYRVTFRFLITISNQSFLVEIPHI